MDDLNNEKVNVANEAVSNCFDAFKASTESSAKELALAAKRRVRDLSNSSDPSDRKKLLDQWQQNLAISEDRATKDDARQRDAIQARAAARKRQIEEKRAAAAIAEKSKQASSVTGRFQRALGAVKMSKTLSETHQKELLELRRKHEQSEKALRETMQEELDRIKAQLVESEGTTRRLDKLNELTKAQNALASAKDIERFHHELEKTTVEVSKVMDEEKEIQAAIMQKKLKAREQRLRKNQKATVSQNRREEIVAALALEKKNLDSISDFNQLLAALARVNDLQAQLSRLTH